MNMLLIEILACLFAAAFLSLFIGWAIRGSLATREVDEANAAWESKHSELGLRYKQDTEHLEDQVHQLSAESQQLTQHNNNINESLRENEISVHKARADAIELNRQQADTQERLQRIIAQKDEELKRFRDQATKLAAGTGATATGALGVAALNTDTADAKIATLSAKREPWEAERRRLMNSMGDDQATIAIDPADLPSETGFDQLDQTVRIDAQQQADLQNRANREYQQVEAESDKTLTLDDDHTMLLDNNHMNTNRPQQNTNKKPTPGGTPEDNDD